MKKFLALSLSDVVFIMLLNVKMPTIVGILTFMSRSASIAQLVERPLSEREVVGSNPAAAPYQRCKKWY